MQDHRILIITSPLASYYHVTSHPIYIYMMFSRFALLSIALAARAVIAAPVAAIQARDVIGHADVVGFVETVPATTVGSLMLKYKPLLKVSNGCVPFPAVDAAGNTGYASNPPNNSVYLPVH